MASKRKVLIATMYEVEPVFRVVTHPGVNELILIIDDQMDEVRKKSLRVISDSIGKVLSVETVEVSKFNIVDISTKVVDIIDK